MPSASTAGEKGSCEEEKNAAFLFILEGRNALQSGLALIDNPYPPGSHESDCWLRGWLRAQGTAQAANQIGSKPLS